MTVTLHLTAEVEAGLSAHAKAQGMMLEDYLLSLAKDAASATLDPKPPAAHAGREEAVRKMLEFGEKYNLSMGEPITRTLLHEGHRF